MPLRPLSDVSPADWFVDSDAAWRAKVALGPPGFEAYVRVLYDLDEEAPVDSDERLRADLRDVLARHTSTPDDCFFALWDGTGTELPTPPSGTVFSVTGWIPEVRVHTPMRRYHLYAGALADAVECGEIDGPHLMWPADHAWFVAGDVDPDWIGVGGSQALIDDVLADNRLDAVPTPYGPDQAEYR